MEVDKLISMKEKRKGRQREREESERKDKYGEKIEKKKREVDK